MRFPQPSLEWHAIPTCASVLKCSRGWPRILGSNALVCFVLFAPGLQDLLRIGEQLDATEQKNGALPGGEPPLSSSTHVPRPAVPPQSLLRRGT